MPLAYFLASLVGWLVSCLEERGKKRWVRRDGWETWIWGGFSFEGRGGGGGVGMGWDISRKKEKQRDMFFCRHI